MDYDQYDQRENSSQDYSGNHYYRQPAPQKRSSFAVASMACGIISLILCCTGVFSLTFGSLGILFAVLTYRRGQRMDSLSIAGVWTSSVGMALGILITISVLAQIPAMLRDPGLRKDLDNTYESIYGEDFSEFWENHYGIHIE